MLRRSTVLAISFLLVASPAVGSSGPWTWPLDHHEVGDRFAPPATDYGPGHRGVDMSAATGSVVRAVAPGRVTFAGRVGGTPVMTIDHGQERSTYQPVRPRVKVGDSVRAGQPIGILLGSPSHCSGACLHLGRLVDDAYLDPLQLLGGRRFRLIDPHGKPPAPPAGVGDGSLRRPVGGPVTSPYGMRVHPVTGVRKLHDGTDFGVPCGTPVRAAGPGTVVSLGDTGAYGLRVVIRHRPGFETSYNHLSSESVSVGDRVKVGHIVGRSGNTGVSTGCHLHFMVLEGNKPVDPQKFL